ncbi:MAG: hypothetical protein RMZ41_010240 [Nostoc sp. DedVER02]|uniref:hypothetical protein n=1 Tax=unclassified Nostoc TaxID=2593658 RepID=UPI002AD3D3E1|nr:MULTISPECIES: hypothetical protein [unclassified Nostoc]MDZ7986380.1 hypothetical protein [Nostoc sp. DedVER02]MDZ8112770.1 hypothetical protein [Nostoc sp. DedVER01b]
MTYALYKLIMVCVYENRLFQAFINYRLMVNLSLFCHFPAERSLLTQYAWVFETR